MTVDNPFTPYRFEHQGVHHYYLPAHLTSRLLEQRQSLVIGSRGTGKTTLLHALNWKERLENPSLIQQLNSDPFADRCIGTYMKFPKFDLQDLSAWEELGPVVASRMTSAFLEAAWVELLALAMSALASERRLKIDYQKERHTVRLICRDIPALAAQANARSVSALDDLADVARSLHAKIDNLTTWGAGSRRQLESEFSLPPVGQMIRLVSQRLAELCNASLSSQERRWFFKICLDEGEALTTFQQKLLNTIIRHMEWPAFFVVAYVRVPDDPYSTLNPQVASFPVDRTVIFIDHLNARDFRDMAEGICNVRLRAVLGKDAPSLRLDGLLGKLNLNRLLARSLSASTNSAAQALYSQAKDAAEDFLGKPKPADSQGGQESGGKAQPDSFVPDPASVVDEDKPPPIYQIYLIKKLNLELPPTEATAWQREAFRKQLRGRMVAAYLSICSDFDMRPRYASADMILQLSDLCVRDFLTQMKFIFERSAVSLKQFVGGRVSDAVQDAGITDASEHKSTLAGELIAEHTREAVQLLNALGRLTANLQTKSPSNQHLSWRGVERGWFALPPELGFAPSTESELRSVLLEAGDQAYMRFRASPKDTVTCRLHALLAPKYGFSYRGAISVVPLSAANLSLMTKCPPDQLSEVVAKLTGALGGVVEDDTSSSPGLFDVPEEIS